MSKNIFERVDMSINDAFAKEDNVLAGVIRSLEKENLPQHSISPIQGKFLQIMSRLCNAIEVDPSHARVANENIIKAGLAEKVDLRVGMGLKYYLKYRIIRKDIKTKCAIERTISYR